MILYAFISLESRTTRMGLGKLPERCRLNMLREGGAKEELGRSDAAKEERDGPALETAG